MSGPLLLRRVGRPDLCLVGLNCRGTLMESIRIREYMNPRPAIFRSDQTVYEAIHALLTAGLTGGPVVDAQHRLVGFLSEHDCLLAGIEATYTCQQLASVEQLMSKEVLSVAPDDSIIELAQRMAGPKPKIYPVLDEDGKLLGTISRQDVLRAMEKTMRSCFGHKQAPHAR